MLAMVIHWYDFVEVYTVLLVWMVTPLAFLALFMWMHRRVGLVATVNAEQNVEKHDAKI